MSSKSSVQVCIKVRPFDREHCLWQVRDGRIYLTDVQAEPYVFDHVFDQESTNQDVFELMAKHIVHACLQGFNGTIFAYGQTSSGKTYTMMGDEHNPGVMVLAAKEIFNQISQIHDRKFLIRVGYIEIYNEKIYDLLNKKNQDLKIHDSATGIVNVNCEEFIITTEEDLLNFLCMGNKERTVGETHMNERSSRSHAIFRIIIESQKSDAAEDDSVIQSVLNLVDLAGSERADQTGARGARLKEGGHINKSLLFLSNVIKNLAENTDNKYISYRDSKLTRILQASLGGNALTSIICTIKPSILEESQSTINFALRAKKIRLKPQVNEIVSGPTMMKRLEREIKTLKDNLAEEKRKNESQVKVHQLQEAIKRDMLKIISSNSLNNLKIQKRRRTWCPATSVIDGDKGEKTQPVTTFESTSRLQLPKPCMFSKVTHHKNNRSKICPETISVFKSLNLENVKEEFTPIDRVDFGCEPSDFQTPRAQGRNIMSISLTPEVEQMAGKSLEMVEKELFELQMYTSLEKQLDVKFDQNKVLKEKLALVSARRDELEAERLEYIQLKIDLDVCTKNQVDLETRCDLLQAEVDKLTALNQKINAMNENYEIEINRLKDSMKVLEAENREAVSIEFQYESNKQKSKQREAELLEALLEKDGAIDSWKKTVDELSKKLHESQQQSESKSFKDSVINNLEKTVDELSKKLLESEQQSESKSSQDEINSLKVRVEETQCNLDRVSSDLRHKECELNEKISFHQSKFDELQREYDDLSNQLLESIQDGDLLRARCKKLSDFLKKQPMNIICSQWCNGEAMPGSELVSNFNNSSLYSQFAKFLESLHEIELGDIGYSRTFRAITVNEINGAGHKLHLNFTEKILHPSFDESICLEGVLQQQKFHIVELSENSKVGIQSLRNYVDQLEAEILEKNVLLETTEHTINEMREQMTTLECALLEKSVIINKVENYQKKIETLEKQNAEMTIVCEELQEKVKECTMTESLDCSSCKGAPNCNQSEMSEKLLELEAALASSKSELESREKAHKETKDSIVWEELQCKVKECTMTESLDCSNCKRAPNCTQSEISEKLLELEAALASTKSELESREKAHKDELNTHKLEFLEKLELSKTEYRENLRNYNMKWEESRDHYEQTLSKMKENLATAEEKLRSYNEYHLKYEKLKEEKCALESVISDSKLQILSLTTDLNEQKQKNEKKDGDLKKLNQQVEILELSKNEYVENMRNYKIKLEESRNLYEVALSKIKEKLATAEEKLGSYNEYQLKYEKLQEEKCALETVIEDSKLQISSLTTDLTEQKHKNAIDEEDLNKLKQHVENLELGKNEYQENLRNYKIKLEESRDFYEQTLSKLKEKLAVAEEKIGSYNEYQLKYEMLQEEKCALETVIADSKLQICSLTTDVKEQKHKNEKDEEDLKKLKQHVENLELCKNEYQENLRNYNIKLEESRDLYEQTLSKMKENLATAEEYKLKYEKLKDEKCALETVIAESKLQICSLATELKEQKHKNAIHEEDFKKLTGEVKNLESALKQITALKTAAEGKIEQHGTESARLNATILCLLEEKSNLEEKLCTMEDTIRSLDAELVAFKSDKSVKLFTELNTSNTQLTARKSLDRDDSLTKKRPNTDSQMRRSRRLSTHDERRRQCWNESCDDGSLNDAGEMAELKRKLEDCQRDLFISQSKVTALSIELKNHPLKEETAQLKKRLQDEKEKQRNELKRFKQKNHELMSKVNALTAAAALSTNAADVSCHRVVDNSSLVTSGTQTESDLETAHKKLTEKYEDMLEVCRFRYNIIKNQQEQLKQFENIDTSNTSSLTAGQICALKAQCDRQKAELSALTEKYDMAKKALKMRKVQVEDLRKQMADPSGTHSSEIILRNIYSTIVKTSHAIDYL
ncbi:kinesin-like protein KIN-7I [Scaptodrosophila lebanonensis]|uniref:Centromere-associated protein E n=1 Tax=Drosophila lebanonensis TaxID=7225 RepID=A0A6J2U7Y6_DROLE|nr:kinesin-like protein KIN-7I [Scaptodrosophila lebanonensis]